MSRIIQITDQSTMSFLLSQTSMIESEVNRTIYPDIQYRDLVPVVGGNEYATSVTYYSSDNFGKADWINGNADDIPRAGTTRQKFETSIHMAGIGYGWGKTELGRAQLLGIDLQAEDALAARRAAEEMIDRVALQGDTAKGFTGLFNAAGVTPAAAPTGTWGTATPVQIVADMNAALMNVFNGTNTTAMADRLLLPWTKFFAISTTQMSAASDSTILQWFIANNVYTAATGRPLTIRGLRGLDTAGAGGTARMVAYRYDRNVLVMHVPMPHRFEPAWQSGPLRWDVPGVMSIGGLDVRRPKEVAYIDGI